MEHTCYGPLVGLQMIAEFTFSQTSFYGNICTMYPLIAESSVGEKISKIIANIATDICNDAIISGHFEMKNYAELIAKACSEINAEILQALSENKAYFAVYDKASVIDAIDDTMEYEPATKTSCDGLIRYNTGLAAMPVTHEFLH